MAKKILTAMILVLIALSLTACAAGPNDLKDTPAAKGKAAGFWLGLWHGAISIVTFIISLFNSKVNVYEVHNNGGWYNFGFILGCSIAFGGGSHGARKGWRYRKDD